MGLKAKLSRALRPAFSWVKARSRRLWRCGRHKRLLCWTKRLVLTVLAVTLIPVLMDLWIRGRIPEERRNPLNRLLIAIYRPLLDATLRHPWFTLLLAAVVFASTLWPLTRMGGEFLPPHRQIDQ